ncbi:UDP-N-acetylglucosamine 1-carboxyvinyltransferase [Picosynechococcus sp. PCC 7003]|uniref:UDP-N-acetylglucosamine 1-carboxyvinyltransferase n=1 Tax=Picosynechococcus sp. PCC 7003 TaxID=374981 RepID=UPI000810E6D5|nr:UDP-N-acetylglucosamine 1-carboxyvinyltransferase [Picosynechococcus sp. PCC 7003]ANV85559.1 UDP-N-acetylglucosamine 1-carboxyvinyltransferase [Picosynechococcus sp. PCC 7003]
MKTSAPPLTSPSTTTETILKIEGQHPLSGEVKISGAKNSALAIMAGTLLCSDQCRLTNIPNLADIKRMVEVIAALGVNITAAPGSLDFDTRHLSTTEAPYELVSKLRASFFIIGPLLARLGEAKVPMPGGCAIGARPVDLHVRGLQAMGADVIIEHGVVQAKIRGNRRRLQGTKIYLDYPSVGATETLMMAATLAEGETVLENAAQEPEIVDLANFCRSMGAKITGDGSNKIVIQGCDRLHTTDYPIIPDRIEAGTFLVAGAITQSEFSIFPVVPDHLLPVIAKLEATGTKVIAEGPNRLRIKPQGILRATDIETLPYPGFPTDMQAQFMALLTLCEGSSVVTETVFENRMHHVAEFKRMGADVKVKGNNAIIKGVPFLSGAPVMATDLRASAALVLVGLAAEGTTIMREVHHMDRGYDDLEGKFKALGAKIERLTATL